MVHNNLKQKTAYFRLLYLCRRIALMEITLSLDPAVIQFYTRIAHTAGLPPEQVMADALFKLAGELSLQALHKGKE